MSFTSFHLFHDDLEIGQMWESAGRTVTETDIVNFAGISGDFNAIHVDQEFAKKTPYRRPIAHGLLVWAISSGLSAWSPPVRMVAFVAMKSWDLRAPVFAGDTIHVRTKIIGKEVRSRGRRAVITWEREVVNQDDKVVHVGVVETLIEGRAALKTRDAAAEPDTLES